MAADAIEEAGATRQRPREFDDIRKRHLPEDRAHTKAQHHNAEYALRAAAIVRAGVVPGLLDEVIWWDTDDLWFRALEALVTYVRAAAEHGVETVPTICGRIASRRRARSHYLTSTPKSLGGRRFVGWAATCADGPGTRCDDFAEPLTGTRAARGKHCATSRPSGSVSYAGVGGQPDE